MSKVPNTVRRTGVFYFRKAIPQQLRQALRRSEITCSLRTNDAVLARVRARRLDLCSEELFAFARSGFVLPEDTLATLMQDFYQSVLDRENELRLLDRMPLDEAGRLRRVEEWAGRSRQAKADLAANRFESVDFIAAALIHKHGLAGQLQPIEVRQVQQGMLRAAYEVAEALRARFEGNFEHNPSDRLMTRDVSQTPIGTRMAARPAKGPKADRKPSRGSSLRFSQRSEVFREQQLKRGHWEMQSYLQHAASYRLFIEICGDRNLDDYARKDAVLYRDTLLRLPHDYAKAAHFRGKSVAHILAASKHVTETISPRTVQRHLSALSGLWSDAIEADELQNNVFRGLKLPASKRPNEQRSMWTAEQLQQLFDTPLWRGCHSAGRRTTPGSVVVRDERFWLPLIAVFSGMRQEEICQLRLEDVRQEGGVWVLDINNRPPRKLKNRSSVRLVPIHDELHRLGFLRYVEEQRQAGMDRVFHQLGSGGAEGRFGHNFAKWFTRYRRDVGLYAPGLDFHSFRHSATTFMQRGNVSLSIIDALTGHVSAGETARYSKGFEIAQLKDGINAIRPQLDLEHLLPPD